MPELQAESPAIREALLKSERLRIYILLASFAAIFLVRSVRTIVYWSPENISIWLGSALLVLLLAAYESIRLFIVRRVLQIHRDLPKWAWFANILVETSLPAVAQAYFPATSLEPAFRPVANPVFLLYFLLIILSTLRLNAWMCRLSGLTAAISYLLAAMHLGWRLSFAGHPSLLSPEKTVVTYAISLLVGGAAAGVVARQIRIQVEAALREAETRRQMEHLQHDLEVARSIQQSLLPASIPEVAGFELAAWNQPADQTGGDYYDWQQLPDGKILVALADVTGHGIGPALLAAVCRAYSRANFRAQNGFMDAMEQINSAVAADVGEGRFVTLVAVICTPGSSRVELLSAGHAPLFLYWLKEDRFDKMEAQGLPLGISPTFLSEPPQAIDMSPGDILVLATDGFFEWQNAKEELFGTDRLGDTIRASRHKPPAEIISSLYQEVVKFSGGTKQMDDLTAIVIKRI
jgi:serine phosphatase RsbU (regulator of sigma subunit)